MVDISEQLYVIDHSDEGAEIKEAIVDALDVLSQADDHKVREYDIDFAKMFCFGIVDRCLIGFSEVIE